MFVKGSNVQLAGRNESPDQPLFLDGTFRITPNVCKDGQVDKYSFQLHASLIIEEITLEVKTCHDSLQVLWPLQSNL